jgi:serine/threonine protein kinase
VKVVPVPSRRAFARELARARVPVHANLVQVLDGGVADGCGYLVMQWVDGLDLELVAGLLRLHGELIAPPLAAFIVGQVLRGLDYVHHLDGGGEAHGGVQGSHVLLSIAGEVKLGGHGRAHRSSCADDMFEVGLVLHELLTGERTRAPDLGRHDGVPRPLDELRRRLLLSDPAQRPTVREALRALETWGGHADHTTALTDLMRALTGVHNPRTVEPYDLPPPARWHRVVAAAGAVAAITAGVLAWL